ncbi:hypothetical protein IFM47457_07793 [Aspergillus lentulus]|nr:hypothetical protein IFM47457_07793 [Aspergillus lentulus]
MITVTDDEVMSALILAADASRRITIEIPTWLLMDSKKKESQTKIPAHVTNDCASYATPAYRVPRSHLLTIVLET